MPRSFRLGITGKIGSGKSVFSEMLRAEGVTVLDTDAIAKQIMAEDAEVKSELITLFGKEAFTDTHLNTKFLAERIFSDVEKRISVEELVHPKVTQQLERIFSDAGAGAIIGVESALLLQTGYDELFDALVLISSSDKAIVERNNISGRFSETDLLARLADQGYSDELESDADFVITNDSTLEAFRERSSKVIMILQIMAAGELPDVPLRVIE